MKRRLAALILTFALALTGTVQATASINNTISHIAPSGITALEGGGYLITDLFNKVIWNVGSDGTVTHMAGQFSVPDISGEPVGLLADGPLLTAYFQNPWGIAPFLDGYLVSEPDSNVIRYISSSAVQTAAGSGQRGFRDAVGTGALFARPTGLAAGTNGEVYIADTDNGAIRCLDRVGNVTTVYTGLLEPTGLCWYDGALYVAETGAHCISRIQNGKRTILAGTEGTEGYTDGRAAVSRMRSPLGVAVSTDGTVYIADTGNGAVRQLRDGVLSTLCRSSESNTPVRPRSILITGDTMLITDPFAKNVFSISLTREIFTDVAAGSWYEEAIYAAVERGLFNGMGNHLFAPNATTNRAMLAQMLANLQQQMDGDIIIAGADTLSDVADSNWYAAPTRWAVDRGILSADGGIFDPLREITRQEMTVAIWKLAELMGADTSDRADLSRYKDAALVDSAAQDAMSWALSTGLIRGVSSDELSPLTVTTRAQMVQVMIRFMDLLQK